MNPKSQALLEAVLELPDIDRAEIVNELLSTLPLEMVEAEEDEFAAELERRYDEAQSDSTATILWSELRDEE